MKIILIVDMLRLAFSKKNFSKKLSYSFRGLIFLPFLVYEEIKNKQLRRGLADTNQLGDDVYPLF